MSEFKGKKTVQLKGYKGAELYDASGKLASESAEFTLTYGDIMWKKNLKNLKYLGLTKIEVTDYFEGEDSKEIPKEIIDEVANELKLQTAPLTAEQLRLANLESENKEMKEQLDELLKAKKKTETK